MIPVVFGKKEGAYYYFFESGEIAVTGNYSNDVKVGKWIEFYPGGTRRKKEIEYPESPWDAIGKPRILREWNSQGRVVYDYNTFLRDTSS